MRGRAQHKHGGDNGEGSEENEAESEQRDVISTVLGTVNKVCRARVN